MLRPFGMSLGGPTAPPRSEPSPELPAVIKELIRDPSQLQQIAARLQREDPALLQELVQWL
ncbi:MAG: hypothetical protein ACQESR_13360 [Planctomycetota bacterium]